MYKLPSEAITAYQARLNDEWFAVNMYQAMSMYFEQNGYMIAAKWAKKESEEEIEHAERLQGHLVGWNTIPSREPQQMNFEFSSVKDVLQQAYEVEYNLYLAYSDDYKNLSEYPSCQIFISKFIKIQQESVIGLSDKLNMLAGVETEFEYRQMESIIFN